MKPLPILPRALPTLHLPYPNLPAHSGSSIGTHIEEVLRHDEATRRPPHVRKTTPPVVKGYIPPELRPIPPVGYVRPVVPDAGGVGMSGVGWQTGMTGSVNGSQGCTGVELDQGGSSSSRYDPSQRSTCPSVGYEGSQLTVPGTVSSGSTWSVSDTNEINHDFYQVADPTVYRLDPVPMHAHHISQHTMTTYTYSTVPRLHPASVSLESPYVCETNTFQYQYTFPPGPNGLAHPPFPAVLQPQQPVHPPHTWTSQPAQAPTHIPYVPSQVRPNPPVQPGTILPPQLYHAPLQHALFPPQIQPPPFLPPARPHGQARRSRIPTPITIPSQSRPPTRVNQRAPTAQLPTLVPLPLLPDTLLPLGTTQPVEPFTPSLVTPQQHTLMSSTATQPEPTLAHQNNFAEPLYGLGLFEGNESSEVSTFEGAVKAITTVQPLVRNESDMSPSNTEYPPTLPVDQFATGAWSEHQTFSNAGNGLFISPSTTELSFDPATLNFSSFSSIYQPITNLNNEPPVVPQASESALQSSFLHSPALIPPTPLTSIPIFSRPAHQILNTLIPARAGTTSSSSELSSAASSRAESTPRPSSSSATAKQSNRAIKGRAMSSKPTKKRTDVVILRRSDAPDPGVDRFPCTEKGCEETFTRPSDMIRHHERLHVPYAEWRYECGDCNARFSRKDHLSIHVRRNRCPGVRAEDSERKKSGQTRPQ